MRTDILKINSNNSIIKNSTLNPVKRKKIYWLLQIFGWTFLIALNLIIYSSFKTLTFGDFVVGAVMVFFGISLTHIYRRYIKKKSWTSLPLKKIVPRILIASLVIGFLIFIPAFATSYLLGLEEETKHFTASIISGILNLSSIVLFWSLIYFAIHYFENSQRAEIESLIFEAAVKDFELKTLKAQLNPHFMFNAMNSIRALIEEDPQNARDAITKLSNLMRYTLKIERSETVLLSEELRTIKDYLDLEKIRFEERLRYNIQSTSEADRVEVPPMMVQTLVENGIKHGISKITNGGEVTVDAKVIANNLVIEIRNSGNFDGEAFKNSSGFGVANTKHRLNLLYGGDASFNLLNENNSTVLAKLKIPSGGSKQ